MLLLAQHPLVSLRRCDHDAAAPAHLVLPMAAPYHLDSQDHVRVHRELGDEALAIKLGFASVSRHPTAGLSAPPKDFQVKRRHLSVVSRIAAWGQGSPEQTVSLAIKRRGLLPQ